MAHVLHVLASSWSPAVIAAFVASGVTLGGTVVRDARQRRREAAAAARQVRASAYGDLLSHSLLLVARVQAVRMALPLRSGIAEGLSVTVQWFETAFMTILVSTPSPQAPYKLDPGVASAKALWVGIAEYQVAWPFTPIELDDLDDLTNRWGGWFAAASRGALAHPTTMPERSPQGTWRLS